jgi:L-lactate dehydrogenase (cytochrome)
MRAVIAFVRRRTFANHCLTPTARRSWSIAEAQVDFPGATTLSIRSWRNVEDARKAAKRKIPGPIYDYMDGGADDEIALNRNCSSFSNYPLIPKVLNISRPVELNTHVLGASLSLPLILSPTGLTRMFHDDAELAVAKAAADRGLGYCLSTMGTTSIEQLAQASSGPKFFQIYIFKDRGLTREFVERARENRYDALVLTVDTPVAGNRERDRANGLSLPPRLGLKSLLSFAAHPRWAIGALSGRRFNFANVAHRVDGLANGPISLFRYIEDQFDPFISWRDLEQLAELWGGPIAVKGVMAPEDSLRAIERGATAIMVSNHGGRQLGVAPAPVDLISRHAEAVQGRAEIICDGGIRRGSDIVTALALGATACAIGRPYLYGLAGGGEAGVGRVLDILRDEMERTMMLAGAANASMLDRSAVIAAAA